jgi:hypothetical protein
MNSAAPKDDGPSIHAVNFFKLNIKSTKKPDDASP